MPRDVQREHRNVGSINAIFRNDTVPRIPRDDGSCNPDERWTSFISRHDVNPCENRGQNKTVGDERDTTDSGTSLRDASNSDIVSLKIFNAEHCNRFHKYKAVGRFLKTSTKFYRKPIPSSSLFKGIWCKMKCKYFFRSSLILTFASKNTVKIRIKWTEKYV